MTFMPGGIRQLEQVRKDELEQRALEVSQCGRFLKKVNEKNSTYHSRERIGQKNFFSREAVHQVKATALLEDFSAGKNPHISLASVMAKIREAEAKAKEVAAAESGIPWNPEFVEPRHFPIIERNSCGRASVRRKMTTISRKHKQTRSLDPIFHFGRDGSGENHQNRRK